MDHPLPPPAWISKRDGRLEPFDADKISRSLFAATETLGRPNAFLARELTDGVLHFLKAEFENAIPTTAQVTELVAKVVRELGQPALAQAYAVSGPRSAVRDQPTLETGRPNPPPTVGPTLAQIGEWIAFEQSPAGLLRRVGQACLREYSLREVFTRDLVAAHQEGLLTLTGLEAPTELHGYHLEVQPADSRNLARFIEEARFIVGQVVALDGLEYALRSGPEEGKGTIAGALSHLVQGLERTGLQAVVNLNSALPPRWASDLAEGPLFGQPSGQPRSDLDDLRDTWLGQWEAPAAGVPVRIDWHLGDADIAEGNNGRLTGLVRRALSGFPLMFVFDRPRRPISLAEGLDRQHPGVLLVVGLHLPALRERQGQQADAPEYLQKLGSLARLALSAGVQKRDFLRRHSQGRPGLRRGFLLDRARLVVVPVGLEAVVRGLAGRSLGGGGAGLDLARQILRRLREVLEQDGRALHLETCLDSAAAFSLDTSTEPTAEQIAGLTPWDPTVPPRQQMKAAGHLHGVAERGTAAVLFSEDRPLAVDEAVTLVRYARRQTDVNRLSFQRATPSRHQLTAPWEAGS